MIAFSNVLWITEPGVPRRLTTSACVRPGGIFANRSAPDCAVSPGVAQAPSVSATATARMVFESFELMVDLLSIVITLGIGLRDPAGRVECHVELGGVTPEVGERIDPRRFVLARIAGHVACGADV